MTTNLLMALGATLFFGLAACGHGDNAPPTRASAAGAPNAVLTPAAAGDGATAALHGGAEPPAHKRTLRYYLADAVQARRLETKEGLRMEEAEVLRDAALRAKLAALDLDQVPDGPLARCPPATELRFEDKDGREVGRIGFCGGAARFDSPDGTRGGIRAQ